jgi:hypothetical protein
MYRAAGPENDDVLVIAGFFSYGLSKLYPTCAEMA